MTRLGSSACNGWRMSETRADLVRIPPPPRPLTLASLPNPVAINLARTGVIVIDRQNNICREAIC